MLAAIKAEGEAHAALLAGDTDAATAAYARAVESYRASWALAPPKSYGRLVGLLKAAVLGGSGRANGRSRRKRRPSPRTATTSGGRRPCSARATPGCARRGAAGA